MIEEEVVGLLANLPGVVVITAGPENNAPEVSWGDSFFFYDPDGTSDRRQPFATIVTKDYPGFDTLSNLDRPGVFRLNLAVGRDVFERLFGFSPAQFADRAAEFDFAVPDRVIPHPPYTRRKAGSRSRCRAHTRDQVRELVNHAYRRARDRHQRNP